MTGKIEQLIMKIGATIMIILVFCYGVVLFIDITKEFKTFGKECESRGYKIYDYSGHKCAEINGGKIIIHHLIKFYNDSYYEING